jgi:sortase A
LRKTILGIASLILVGAGAALIAFFFVGQNPLDEPVAPEAPSEQQEQVGGPTDKTLTVTVPKMQRVKDATVPDGPGDEEMLKNYAGIHLEGTGFPWDQEANVYIAGHRLGYPGYPSFLAFWDQDNLENGDEIFIEDSEGRKYTYRVFTTLVVDPTDLWVTEVIPGKNIVTLQTCTLPDYAQRLVTQAELVSEA